MGIRDLNKQLIITSCLTGDVICVVPYSVYSSDSIYSLLKDLADRFIFADEEGFQIKFGNML